MPYLTLRDVAADKVGELCLALTQYAEALPKLSGASRVDSLGRFFDDRIETVRRDREGVRELCSSLDIESRENRSAIMAALIEEAKRVCSLEGSPPARDAALVGIAQRIEHDLIASVRQVQRYMVELKVRGFDKRLGEILHEAEAAERLLSTIAHGRLFERGLDRVATEESVR